MIPAPQHYLRSLVSARGGAFSPDASRRRHHRTCNRFRPVIRLPSELFERERGNGLTDAKGQAKTTGSSQRMVRADSASPY